MSGGWRSNFPIVEKRKVHFGRTRETERGNERGRGEIRGPSPIDWPLSERHYESSLSARSLAPGGTSGTTAQQPTSPPRPSSVVRCYREGGRKRRAVSQVTPKVGRALRHLGAQREGGDSLDHFNFPGNRTATSKTIASVEVM